MGGGIIIQQNNAVKAAVQTPAIMSQIPSACQPRVSEICAKGCAEWTEEDYVYMVMMCVMARRAG